MANFHRLIFCLVLLLLSWLPASVFATDCAAALAAANDRGAAFVSASTSGYNTCIAANPGSPGCGGYQATYSSVAVGSPVTSYNSLGTSKFHDGAAQYTNYLLQSFSCASYPTPPAGPVCPTGETANFRFQLGWVPENATPYTSAPASVCAIAGSGALCTFALDVGMKMAWGAPVNGSLAWIQDVTGTSSGASCSGTPWSPGATPAPPPCAGQQGVVNGVPVCLATESAASKESRALNAAALAAGLASAAAAAAGASADVAAAAGSAAGAAAGSAIRSGGSAGAAAAAGASAGAAVAGGGTGVAGAAAGAGAAAAAAATAAAVAAGKTAEQIAAAAAAASAAATVAAAAGASATSAAAAGSAAGAAAANGATAAGSAAAGAAGASGAPGAPGVPGASGLEQYCADNPTAAICKKAEDSKFSGICGAAPECEGDAIMCAIAAEAKLTACALKTASDAGDEYDAAKTNTGNQTGDLPGNDTVTISSSSFSSVNILGAAVGMADVNVVVMGKAITLPFSSINIWLERLGLMFQAVTFLLCIRIVSRG